MTLHFCWKAVHHLQQILAKHESRGRPNMGVHFPMSQVQGSQAEDVFNFFQKQTNDSYRFISDLMDVFLMAGVHQQPDQSNYLAEGQT